jgi:hypothetical protein
MKPRFLPFSANPTISLMSLAALATASLSAYTKATPSSARSSSSNPSTQRSQISNSSKTRLKPSKTRSNQDKLRKNASNLAGSVLSLTQARPPSSAQARRNSSSKNRSRSGSRSSRGSDSNDSSASSTASRSPSPSPRTKSSKKAAALSIFRPKLLKSAKTFSNSHNSNDRSGAAQLSAENAALRSELKGIRQKYRDFKARTRAEAEKVQAQSQAKTAKLVGISRVGGNSRGDDWTRLGKGNFAPYHDAHELRLAYETIKIHAVQLNLLRSELSAMKNENSILRQQLGLYRANNSLAADSFPSNFRAQTHQNYDFSTQNKSLSPSKSTSKLDVLSIFSAPAASPSPAADAAYLARIEAQLGCEKEKNSSYSPNKAQFGTNFDSKAEEERKIRDFRAILGAESVKLELFSPDALSSTKSFEVMKS